MHVLVRVIVLPFCMQCVSCIAVCLPHALSSSVNNSDCDLF